MSRVNLADTIGKVYIISNGKKRQVQAKIPETVDEVVEPEAAPISDGDKVLTGQDSYVIDISDSNPSGVTKIILAPESEIELHITGKQSIRTITPHNGMCLVMGHPDLHLPYVNVSYESDVDFFGWIEKKGSKTVLAQKAGYLKLTHKKTGKAITFRGTKQVSISKKGFSKVKEELDSRFYDLYQKFDEVKQKEYALYEDLGQKFEDQFIIEMKRHIKETREEIKKVEAEGGSVVFLKTELAKMQKMLQDAIRDKRKNEEYRAKKAQKSKEAKEFQKKFDKRRTKFQQELDKMAGEVDSFESGKGVKSDSGEDMTDLEKKIAGLDTGSDAEKAENTPTNQGSELSDLEKKIAGMDAGTSDTQEQSSEDNNQGMTELEKKIAGLDASPPKESEESQKTKEGTDKSKKQQEK